MKLRRGASSAGASGSGPPPTQQTPGMKPIKQAAGSGSRATGDAGHAESHVGTGKRKQACPSPGTLGKKVAVKSRKDEAHEDLQQFFLFKSEPSDFSVDQLAKEGASCWDGVRNYQARNIMRSMRVGDQAFFYHSSCKVPGIVGIVKVVKEAYPDHTALEPGNKYYDEKSTAENPRWFMVDVELVRKLKRCITLEELKGMKESVPALSDMALLNRGRLSVQPVSQEVWDYVLSLE